MSGPTADAVVDDVIDREGGYVDNPSDRGGPTKYGVTLAALSAWHTRPMTAADVQALSRTEAHAILRSRYVHAPGFDAIHDASLQAVLVDWGVNSGPFTAIRGLQAALGVPEDGILGEETFRALERFSPLQAYLKVCAERVRFYGRLVTADPALASAAERGYKLQAEFAAGWANRIAAFIEAAG